MGTVPLRCASSDGSNFMTLPSDHGDVSLPTQLSSRTDRPPDYDSLSTALPLQPPCEEPPPTYEECIFGGINMALTDDIEFDSDLNSPARVLESSGALSTSGRHDPANRSSNNSDIFCSQRYYAPVYTYFDFGYEPSSIYRAFASWKSLKRHSCKAFLPSVFYWRWTGCGSYLLHCTDEHVCVVWSIFPSKCILISSQAVYLIDKMQCCRWFDVLFVVLFCDGPLKIFDLTFHF